MVYSEEPHSGYCCWVNQKHDLLPCNRARVWYGGWRENACLDFITHYTRSSLHHHLLSYCISSGPRFDQVAHATLRLSDVKGAIGIYDLVIDTPPTSTGEWNQENFQPLQTFSPLYSTTCSTYFPCSNGKLFPLNPDLGWERLRWTSRLIICCLSTTASAYAMYYVHKKLPRWLDPRVWHYESFVI